MASSRQFSLPFLTALVFLGDVSFARAVTYTYTGDLFTNFSSSSPTINAQAAFGGKSVSGEFTVPNALGADFNGVVNPTEFSFSDGPTTLTSTNFSLSSFDIQTSDAGAIIDWAISVSISSGPASAGISTSNTGDSGFLLGPTTFVGGSNSVAGMWSGPSLATPLPAALPLFASGLVALGLFGWRRKRNAKE